MGHGVFQDKLQGGEKKRVEKKGEKVNTTGKYLLKNQHKEFSSKGDEGGREGVMMDIWANRIYSSGNSCK